MSEQPTKKLYDKMDLRIFGVKYQRKCDQKCKDPIEGCVAVKRLIVTLSYYSRLDIQNSKDGQDIFIAFINDIYPHCLDDFAHLVNKHTNLEEINKALKEKKLFRNCNGKNLRC